MRIVLFLLMLFVAAAPRAATFTVTSAADTAGSICGAVCTLRQAITAANVTQAADTNFAIMVPVWGEILIQPASQLPTISQPLTINGYSQSGTRVNDDPSFSNAILRIRIDGQLAPAGTDGLSLCAANSQIRGLAITRFPDHGIRINSGCSASGSSIAGNFIGLASSGAAAFGNTGAVLLVRSRSAASRWQIAM